MSKRCNSNIALRLTTVDAANRQCNAAMKSFWKGHFDVAITLAGAAEGILERDDVHLFSYLRDHERIAQLDITKKKWISTLNVERDWLKHGGSPEMTITQFSAVIMIARAMSKIETWTPKMEEFKIWLKKYMEGM